MHAFFKKSFVQFLTNFFKSHIDKNDRQAVNRRLTNLSVEELIYIKKIKSMQRDGDGMSATMAAPNT